MTKTIGTITLDILRGHKYANLTTFRKNGQYVITPVWFALEGDKVYVMTSSDTGKAKRLRNNPSALLGPSSGTGKPLGPQVEVVARLLGPEESEHARRALNKKYGLVKSIFDVVMNLRDAGKLRIHLEFTRPSGQEL